MRYAIVSDLHANLQAWNAVLTDIGSNGIDSILCLGDIVGYGPEPVKVLESAYRHVHAFVLGNHDAVACGKMSPDAFNERAKEMILWTKGKLGRRATDFLSSLPLTLDGNNFRCAHGCFNNPAAFGYILSKNDAAASWGAVREPLLFVGHTHTPGIFVVGNSGQPHFITAQDFVFEEGKRFIVNVGSVGSPREDNDIRSCYVIYDDTDQSVVFRRIPFDLDAFRASVIRAGFTEDDVPLLRYDPRKKMTAIRDKAKFASNPAREEDSGSFSPVEINRDVASTDEGMTTQGGFTDVTEHLGFIPAKSHALEVHNAVEVANIEKKLQKKVTHWRIFAAIIFVVGLVCFASGVVYFVSMRRSERSLAIPPMQTMSVSSAIPIGNDGNYLPELPTLIGRDGGVRPWRIVYGSPNNQFIEIIGSRFIIKSLSKEKPFRLEAPPMRLDDDCRDFEITGKIIRSSDFNGVFGFSVDALYTKSRASTPEWTENYETIQFRTVNKSGEVYELAKRTLSLPKSTREIRVSLSGHFTGGVELIFAKMQKKPSD